MGGNGSFSSGALRTEEGRMYETIYMIDDNTAVLEWKNKRLGIKVPEESHTPGRTYVAIKRDGSDVKTIARYGMDGLKMWEIHTDDHHGLHLHYHPWKDGKPIKGDVRVLTEEMNNLLQKIRNLKK